MDIRRSNAQRAVIQPVTRTMPKVARQSKLAPIAVNSQEGTQQAAVLPAEDSVETTMSSVAPVKLPEPPPERSADHGTELATQAESERQQQAQVSPPQIEIGKKGTMQRRPTAVVAVALLVFGALAATVVYAYFDSKGLATGGMIEKVQQDRSAEASAIEVLGAVESELDVLINSADDSQEIPTAGLDEQSLGL